MNEPLSHTGNVIGALTIALADRMAEAVTQAGAGSVTAAAALSSLEDFLDAPTVGRVQEVLGLTHSGAVRLVDRLETMGLVTRTTGDDGRVRRVTLTSAGRRVAGEIRAARARVLESALASLAPSERKDFDVLVAKILLSLRRPTGATRWTCRLCDTDACGRDQGLCPFVPGGPAPRG